MKHVCGKCLNARIAELEAIVKTLFKTEDGVSVVPGMTVYGCVDDSVVSRFVVRSIRKDEITVENDYGYWTFNQKTSKCSSTRADAEKANEKEHV